jgi:hypothetical protein
MFAGPVKQTKVQNETGECRLDIQPNDTQQNGTCTLFLGSSLSWVSLG